MLLPFGLFQEVLIEECLFLQTTYLVKQTYLSRHHKKAGNEKCVLYRYNTVVPNVVGRERAGAKPASHYAALIKATCKQSLTDHPLFCTSRVTCLPREGKEEEKATPGEIPRERH